jgi:hypothetical protein
MLLNGNDKETPTAICKLKDKASRARSSAAVKAASVTDLAHFKRFIETQYAIGLKTTPKASPAATRPREKPSKTASGLAFTSLPRLWTYRAL